MSSESLITNIVYNVKMDRDISILSDQITIPPEDLSYAINVIDTETYFLNDQIYISDVNKEKNNNFDIIIIIKLLSIILIILLVWICFLYM